MNRLANNYVFAALSGTVVIVLAVLAFIVLVSTQDLQDWPASGFGLHPGDGGGAPAIGDATPLPSRPRAIRGSGASAAGGVIPKAAAATIAAGPSGGRKHSGGTGGGATRAPAGVTAVISPASAYPAPGHHAAAHQPANAGAPTPEPAGVPPSPAAGQGASAPSPPPLSTPAPTPTKVVVTGPSSNSHPELDSVSPVVESTEDPGDGEGQDEESPAPTQGEGEAAEETPPTQGEGEAAEETPPTEPVEQGSDGEETPPTQPAEQGSEGEGSLPLPGVDGEG